MSNNAIQFSVSAQQLAAIREQGSDPEICAPVEGTSNMYFVEITQKKFPALLRAMYRWGRKVGRNEVKPTGKLVTMYPHDGKKAAAL